MVVVIGAGVVGLAAANALAARGREVAVLERHRRPGLETSTRNSGVIHAGLYYPPGSLKAALCVDGRERLYAFCREHHVPHVNCGKLIVGGPGEAGDLERLARNAAANGVEVEAVPRAFVRAKEPHVAATAALWSPRTGWIDADAYVRALERVARSRGVALLSDTPLIGAEPRGAALLLTTPREQIEADAVVNAAGLYADDVSRMLGGEAFQIHPCRGEYAVLAPRARHLVKGLVYPVPPASGHSLGLHLTRTIGGEVWVGPTARYQDRKDDYEDGRLTVDEFLAPARHLLPEVERDDLRLGGSGIRAKLCPPDAPFADFLIRRDAGNPLVVQAAGIESPGLTASLAIGERVADIVCDS